MSHVRPALYVDGDPSEDQLLDAARAGRLHRADLAQFLIDLSDEIEQVKKDIVATFVVAISSSMSKQGADVGLSNLSATWQKLDVFDAVAADNSPAIECSTVNDSFQFHTKGTFMVHGSIVFSHNESNAGREFSMRLYNETDAAGANAIDLPTGRNTPASAATFAFRAPITVDQEDDVYSLQISSAVDTYTSVIVTTASLDIYSIGTFDGVL